jgi:hypothetical protein
MLPKSGSRMETIALDEARPNGVSTAFVASMRKINLAAKLAALMSQPA